MCVCVCMVVVQVMEVVTQRLWALRVMGSLPLRCRCAFVVVKDAICVFPCDAAGRLDLRQTFVLSSADEDRVYSQGCYVELDTPTSCHCRCEVVKHLCFIFPHDGEHNYAVEQACVLDTQLMTLRVCGHELLSLGHVNTGAGKYHFEVLNDKGLLACFPHTARLECLLHMGWTAQVAAAGLSLLDQPHHILNNQNHSLLLPPPASGACC